MSLPVALYARALTLSLALGRTLLLYYFKRPGSTVIAAASNPQEGDFLFKFVQMVEEKFESAGSLCHIIRLDSANPIDFNGATKLLRSLQVFKIDVIICNGPNPNKPLTRPLAIVDLGLVENHLGAYTIGPLRFFQAMLPLLRISARHHRPQFVLMGSAIGSAADMESHPPNMAVYGTSLRNPSYSIKDVLCYFFGDRSPKTYMAEQKC